jgi:Lipase (class 3)
MQLTTLMKLAFAIYDANNHIISHSFFQLSALNFLKFWTTDAINVTDTVNDVKLNVSEYFGSDKMLLSDFEVDFKNLRETMKKETYRVVMDENGHPRCAITVVSDPDPSKMPNVLISFMGTNWVLQDWQVNLNALETVEFNATSDNAGVVALQVHKGYKEMFDYLWSKINGIKSFLYIHFGEKWNNAEVYVTGHSMGGALAQICAVELGKYCFSVVAVTLAAPGVFREKSLKPLILPYRVVVLNWVNPYDPVPKAASIAGFTRIGYSLTINDTINKKPSLSYGVGFHNRTNYYQSLLVSLLPTAGDIDKVYNSKITFLGVEQFSTRDYTLI